MRLALAAVLISVLSLSSAGCGSGSPTASETGPVEPPPPPEPVPDLVFEAKQYEADYKKDEEAAKEKYANKLVEVAGTVHGVNRSGTVGRLEIGEAGAERFIVECTFKDLEPWKFALPGQTVKVRGRTPGVLFPALQMNECRVVSATGSGPPTFTAAELGAKYAMGPDTLRKELGGKYLVLTGDIDSIEKADSGVVVLSLTKKGVKPRVRATFGVLANADRDRNQAFMDGQKVRILGTLSKYSDSCIVDNCQLLPEK